MYLPISSDEYAQIVQLFKTKASVNIELAVALLEGFGIHAADLFIHLLLEKYWRATNYLETTRLNWHDDGYVYLADKLCNTPHLFSKFFDNFFAQQSSSHWTDILIDVILTYFEKLPENPIMDNFSAYLENNGFDKTFDLCEKWLAVSLPEKDTKLSKHSNWGLIFADFFLQSNFKETFLDKLWDRIMNSFSAKPLIIHFLESDAQELINQRFIEKGFSKMGINLAYFIEMPLCVWVRKHHVIEAPTPKGGYATPGRYYDGEDTERLPPCYACTFVEQCVDLSPFMHWKGLRNICKELHFINCTYVNLEALPNFPKLRELVFEDNRALDFEFLNQYTFSELEYLSLSGNQVEHFPGLNAAYFPKLKSLNLNFGCLQSLDLPEKFPNLQSINISKIPPALQMQAIKKLAALYDLTTLHIYL